VVIFSKIVPGKGEKELPRSRQWQTSGWAGQLIVVAGSEKAVNRRFPGERFGLELLKGLRPLLIKLRVID
jgi:hypothetical protein